MFVLPSPAKGPPFTVFELITSNQLASHLKAQLFGFDEQVAAVFPGRRIRPARLTTDCGLNLLSAFCQWANNETIDEVRTVCVAFLSVTQFCCTVLAPPVD